MIQLVLVIAAVICLSLGFIVIANNTSRPTNRAYFVLSLSSVVWLVANALSVDDGLFSLKGTQHYLFIGRLITPGSLVVTYMLIIFLFTYFAQSLRQHLNKLRLIALPGVLIVCLSFTNLNIYLSDDGSYVLGSLFVPFVLTSICYICSGLYILFFKLKRTKDVYGTHVFYLRWAYLLSIIPGAILGILLPVFSKSEISNLGPVLSIVFLLTIVWLMIKYKLFDIRPVVARVLAYILVLGTIVLLLSIFTLFVVGRFLWSGTTDLLSETVLLCLVIVLSFIIKPLKLFFDKITNSLFYRDAYDPQVFVSDITKIMTSHIGLKELLCDVSSAVNDTLKTEFCVFAVNTPIGVYGVNTNVSEDGYRRYSNDLFNYADHLFSRYKNSEMVIVDELYTENPVVYGRLAKDNVSVLVRLTTTTDYNRNATTVGFVAIGHKKSGGVFNKQDRQVIGTLANSISVAIQNVLRFEEIGRFNETLQKEVEQKTKKLQKTNEKLREIDRTKDEFISLSSHQLRTPLTAIKGYLSILLEGDMGCVAQPQHKMLLQAFNSAQRMVYLISDLLNVSRLRTGKLVIESSPTDLKEIVKEEIDQLTEYAKSRNIKLTMESAKHFPIIMLDNAKTRQVVMNFIDNAIYYTPAGGHIVVKLQDKPQTIELTVNDSGIGVPRAEQYHLFSKFYRAPNARRMRPDGTGLGLYMAKKVIALQGGSIIFKSKEGVGSTFGFSFMKSRVATDKPATGPIHHAENILLLK